MTTEVKTKAAPQYEWIRKINHDASHSALTKKQLYDQIGACNFLIIEIEHNIPELEDMLNSPLMEEEASNGIAIQQSIRESRDELDELNLKVKSCRRTIIGRLEIELENLERKIGDAQPNWNEGAQMRHDITKELEVLRKLVDA